MLHYKYNLKLARILYECNDCDRRVGNIVEIAAGGGGGILGACNRAGKSSLIIVLTVDSRRDCNKRLAP